VYNYTRKTEEAFSPKTASPLPAKRSLRRTLCPTPHRMRPYKALSPSASPSS